jgi:single-strand DNA-binding protein
MSNTVTGTIHHIGQVETFSSGFTKRLLVIHNGKEYSPYVPIEFTKDKTAMLDRLQVGQTVTVHINIEGREYQGKFYPSITGWKIEAQAAAPAPAPVADGDEPF